MSVIGTNCVIVAYKYFLKRIFVVADVLLPYFKFGSGGMVVVGTIDVIGKQGSPIKANNCRRKAQR